MKTEDLKNYIFEQCLTEAKMHPLVMRGAQWVVDQIGGYDGPDAKKLADRMNRGIKRTTNKPTAEHVYNAAQFHYGEILRKHSPGMDRPEVYANMRKQLRAHLGLDGEVNETSDLAAGNLADRRRMQAIGNYDRAANVGREMVADYRETGIWDPDLQRDRKMFSSRMDKAFKSAQKAENRRRGLKGDGSKRTPTQESALNFINGLKRLTETSYKRATEYSKARGKQLSAASSASDSIKSEIDKRKLNGAPQEELAALSMDYKVSKDLVGKIGKKAIAGWLRTAEARKREAPPSIYYDPR